MRAPLRIFVPRDATARSLGADEVAARIAGEMRRLGREIVLVRNGSRGAMWLEPLVEIERNGRRLGFGPVAPDDVAGLVAADFPEAGGHKLALGPVDDLDWFRGQTRITFARCGMEDPLDFDAWRAAGGLGGVERALSLSPEAIVEEIVQSGLRGRGGAGFPTGIKWRTAANAPAPRRYVVCNADEGDSGTFADRMLMEGDPFTLLAGMAVAALAIGADKGFVYVRSEYPDAVETMRAAIVRAEAAGLLGGAILGRGPAFRVEIRVGGGAYVCGEETSLLESIEGRRGEVRAKPPLPAVSGLFGMPTIVNNVVTLATVPAILRDGAEAYAALGHARSRGTSPMQIGGNVRRGGLVEVPFGTGIADIVKGFGGGSATGRPVKAIQMGGPLGAYVPPSAFSLPLDYEALAEAGAMLGHGGIVVFDENADLGRMARFAMEFCAAESCGKCTPCRIGSTRGVEVIDRIRRGEAVDANLMLLEDLCQTMTEGSLCALGGLAPLPVTSVLRHFPGEIEGKGAARPAP